MRRPFILKLLPALEVIEETARNGKNYLRARVPALDKFGLRPARRWYAVTSHDVYATDRDELVGVLAHDKSREGARRQAVAAGGTLVRSLPA